MIVLIVSTLAFAVYCIAKAFINLGVGWGLAVLLAWLIALAFALEDVS